MSYENASDLLKGFEEALVRLRNDLNADEIMVAARFAVEVHGRIGHVRKYTGEPYVVHLFEVALMAAEAGMDAASVMAALLHDSREDAGVGEEEIGGEFGADVGGLVDELTDKARPEDGNRAVRMAMERERLSKVQPRAQSLKCLDTISNTRNIAEHDPKFGRVYVPEKRALLRVMTKGDPKLLAWARAVVDEAAHRLGMPAEGW